MAQTTSNGRVNGNNGSERLWHHPSLRVLKHRYVLHKRLGSGGMGTVYAARDVKQGRRVAVKLMHQRGGTHSLRRFSREVLAMREIDHPQVVGLVDAGIHLGVPFVVMELVDGPSLDAMVERGGKLPERAALQVALYAARGLEAIHASGVVHRDVKPSNLLVLADSSRTLTGVKVTDLGVVRTASSRITRNGSAVGTPAFMSPEQVLGEPVDARADVYGLGVTLFFALTGRLPFVGGGSDVMAYQVLALRPYPSLTAESVAPAVDCIVLSAMRRAPDNRYASMADMRADLERALGMRAGVACGAATPRSPDSYEPSTPAGRDMVASMRVAASHALMPIGAALPRDYDADGYFDSGDDTVENPVAGGEPTEPGHGANGTAVSANLWWKGRA